MMMCRGPQPGDDALATSAFDHHHRLIGLGRWLKKCAGVVGCLVEPTASGFGR